MDFERVDDATLIHYINQRQEMALRELYRRYGRLLFSIAYHMLDNRETAEEITLDVLVRVWERGHTYNPKKASLRTWLVQLTRNRTIDKLRHERIRLEKDSLSWDNRWLEQLAGETPLETEIDHQLEREAVRQAVDTLSPPQQTVLTLAYFRGMTQREIAAQLNEPLGTVKGRIRAAMKQLKALLQRTD